MRSVRSWLVAVGAPGSLACLAAACDTFSIPDDNYENTPGLAPSAAPTVPSSDRELATLRRAPLSGPASSVPDSGIETPGEPRDAGGLAPSMPDAGDPGGELVPPTQPPLPAPPPGAYEPCSGTPVPPLRLQPVATGIINPIFVTSAPHDPTDLFIALRDGTIVRVSEATGTSETFFSVAVSVLGEGGLLSFALHPEFDDVTNRRFFVSYTTSIGAQFTSIVEEYEAGTVGPTLVRELLQLAQPATNHNGGMIAFGPDGYLYVALGDGGPGNDPNAYGQNTADPFGSILRFDVDVPAIPPEGNLSGSGVDSRILHYGLRNPWRFSFDRRTGDLYLGDVGQNAWEEVDVIPRGSPSQNLGWSVLEGLADCTACPDQATPDAMLAPIFTYQGSQTSPVAFDCVTPETGSYDCAVMGGYVYRGNSIPALFGRYLFADYVRARVMLLTWDPEHPNTYCDFVDITDDLLEDTSLSSIASFGEDADGELYVVRLRGNAVYRLVAE